MSAPVERLTACGPPRQDPDDATDGLPASDDPEALDPRRAPVDPLITAIMCGIAGFIDHQQPARAHGPALATMIAALRHRGPDDQGQWYGRHAALGHTRLALVDPEGGTQPMVSPDGRWVLVYNGEVYNDAELRHQLRARWSFTTRSDTEVVLAAAATWGEACLPRLNGMFAFLLWDEQEQRGFLARDRLGVKPLVYRERPRGVAFASEAKALVAAAGERPRANVEAILEVLAAPCFSGVEAPAFAGLHHLGPGQLLRIDRDGLQRETWGPLHLTADRDEPALADELRAALEAAGTRALRGDVPVGVFLSGGLDSTVLAALAARSAAQPPRALTVEFEGQADYDYSRSLIVVSDDTPFARLAADALGLRHERVPVAAAALEEGIAAIARTNDAVPAWEQELAQHHLARAASRGSKAIVVGDAADETHYGYHFLLDERANRSPAHLLARFPPVPTHPDWGPDVAGRFARRYAERLAELGRGGSSPRERVLATTHLVLTRWLPRLLHNGDIHTMACSVEARVPFADVELLTLALQVDPRRAYREGEDKALLRAAVRGLVPEPIRTRRKSALPKDQRTARAYQAMVRRALAEDEGFLAALCDVEALGALASPGRALDEGERAVLFRTAALACWQRAHDVAPP